MNAQQLSDSLASTVTSNGNSIVRVEARRRWPSSGIAFSPELVVTTHHSVEFDEDIEIGLGDGTTRKATLVGRDPGTDIAALKVDGGGLTSASFGDTASLKVGHVVLALARPGRTVRATIGIVSALGEETWRTWSGGKIDRYLEPDLSARPGFSGGALVGADGKVIGLNSWGLTRGNAVTVPHATLKRVVESLQRHGRMRRGYLGVNSQAVRLPAAAEKEAQQQAGLLVVGVQPGGPADKAGVLLGDVIVSVDRQSVESVDALLGALDEERIGKEITVKLLRAGAFLDKKLTVAARP